MSHSISIKKEASVKSISVIYTYGEQEKETPITTTATKTIDFDAGTKVSISTWEAADKYVEPIYIKNDSSGNYYNITENEGWAYQSSSAPSSSYTVVASAEVKIYHRSVAGIALSSETRVLRNGRTIYPADKLYQDDDLLDTYNYKGWSTTATASTYNTQTTTPLTVTSTTKIYQWYEAKPVFTVNASVSGGTITLSTTNGTATKYWIYPVGHDDKGKSNSTGTFSSLPFGQQFYYGASNSSGTAKNSGMVIVTTGGAPAIAGQVVNNTYSVIVSASTKGNYTTYAINGSESAISTSNTSTVPYDSAGKKTISAIFYYTWTGNDKEKTAVLSYSTSINVEIPEISKYTLSLIYCKIEDDEIVEVTRGSIEVEASTTVYITNSKILSTLSGFTNGVGFTEREGWNSSKNGTPNTNSVTINANTTRYVFFSNPEISIDSCAVSDSENRIAITTSDGVGPYKYQITAYYGTETVGTKKTIAKDTEENPYTTPILPYGYSYEITVIDNQEEEATSKQISVKKIAPKVTYEQNANTYEVTFSISYEGSGYSSVLFGVDENGNPKDNVGTTITKTYSQSGSYQENFKFRALWKGTSYIHYTVSIGVEIQPRFQYKIKNYYYYWDTTIKDAQYLSESSTTIVTNSAEFNAPSIEGYTYKSYLLTANEETDESGTSNNFNLHDSKLNNITLYYWKDTYPYSLYLSVNGNTSPDVGEPHYLQTNKSLKTVYNESTGNIPSYLYDYKITTSTGTTIIESHLETKTPDDYEDSSFTISTTDGTLKKNEKVEVYLSYYFWPEWTAVENYKINDKLTVRWRWKYGEPTFKLNYWTDTSKKHEYSITSYKNNDESEYYYQYGRLPGGHTWTSTVTDRKGWQAYNNKTDESTWITEALAPPEPTTFLWTTQDANKKAMNGFHIVFPADTNAYGYKQIKIEYQRYIDDENDWASVTIPTSSSVIDYYLNVNDSSRGIDTHSSTQTIGYRAKITYTDSEIKYHSTTTYEYTCTTDFDMVLAYPIALTLNEHVRSMTLVYTDEYDDFKNNRTYNNKMEQGINSATHYFHVKANTRLAYIGYTLSTGYNGLRWESEIIPKYENNQNGIWINEPKIFDVYYLNAPQVYTVNIGLEDVLDSVTIGYFANDKDSSWQEIPITNHSEFTQIQTSQTDSYIRLISYQTKESADYFNPNSFSPASDNIIENYECYNAFYYRDRPLIFSIERKKIQVNTDLEAFTTSCDFEYVNSTGGNAIASNNTSIIERTPTTSANNFIRINSYSLRLYRKNIYLQEIDTGNIIQPNEASGLYELQWDKEYVITAESYQKPKMELTADKYSITCTFSDIDEDAYIKTHTGHMLTIKKKGENTPIGQYPLSFSKTTHSVTYTDTTIYPYLIQAETTYTITFLPFDKIQNDQIEDSSIIGSITTSNRQTPTFIIPSNDKIGNRFTAILNDYEDFNRVYFYVWADNANFTPETNISVVDNLSANVSSAFVPSEGNFMLNKDYWIKIKLWATDGSNATWRSDILQFHTPSAYTVSLDLKNINKINAQSGANATIAEYANGTSIAVVPNDTFTIANVAEYSSLTTPNTDDGRKMQYKHPVTYKLVNSANNIVKSGTFVNDNNIASPISYKMTNDTPALTLTLIATPADWEWPKGYASIDGTNRTKPILTAGIPTTEFKHQVWNELMFYLKKWSEYKSLTETYVYSAMSEGDTTLTVERYKDALARLNLLFNALSDVIGIPTQGQTPLTAKGLQAFGDSIKYDNYLKE